MEEYTIEAIAGDTKDITLLYKDSDGVAIDLTDYTVYFQCRKSKTDEDISLEKDYQIDDIDGPNGKINLPLTVDDTTLLGVCYPVTTYVYGLRITSLDNTISTTLIAGDLQVTKGVI